MPTILHLRRALEHEGVSASVIQRVLSRLTQSTVSQRPWANILRDVDECIRTLTNGRSRWRPERVPLYESYLQLMQRVRATITHDSDRFPGDPAAAAREAERENTLRASTGKPPGPDKRGHWAYWVPVHVREALCAEFDALYVKEQKSGHPPGRRIIPFTTAAQRQQLDNAWDRLRAQTKVHIDAGQVLQGEAALVAEREALINTIEDVVARDAAIETLHVRHRERYRAAMSANRIIDTLSRMHHSAATAAHADFTVPLHWVHVLPPDERARLRAAEKAAGSYVQPGPPGAQATDRKSVV